jgi:hypothetical protein
MRELNSSSRFPTIIHANLCLRFISALVSLRHHRTIKRSELANQGDPKAILIFFLLPGAKTKFHSQCSHHLCSFTCGIFQQRNVNLFAPEDEFRFSLGMVTAIKADSKLCADKPRHAQVTRLSAVCLRSTWQGGGRPLHCILPLCRRRPAETLPVSTPSGSCAAAAFWSWEVRP